MGLKLVISQRLCDSLQCHDGVGARADAMLRRSNVRRGPFGTRDTEEDVWVSTVTADQRDALEIQQLVTSINLEHHMD